MLQRASDLDGSFGNTYTTENGYEIWNRLTGKISKWISKV
jgi:hypothetical protein